MVRTVHEEARKVSDWPHIDERFIEGRRRHVLEEYHKLRALNKKVATVWWLVLVSSALSGRLR